MKTMILSIGKVLGVTLCLLLLAGPVIQAQEEKVPVTTKSLEAKRLFNEARTQLERYQFHEAKEELKRAIELDPSFALAHLYLSIASTGGSDYEPHELQKAVNLSNNVSLGEKHMIFYAKAFADGNDQKMNNHLEILRNNYPNDERVRYWAGRHYYVKQEYPKAIRQLKKSIEINNQYHPAINMLGYTYMAMNNQDEARKYFTEYIEILPDYANPYDSYAEFLLQTGKFTDAIKYYDKALEYNSTFAASYKGLGDAYLFRGDYLKARENYKNYYKHANNVNQKFQSLLLEAAVEIDENHIDKALDALNRYVELAENEDLPYYKIYGTAYKGFVLAENGKGNEALKEYRKAMSMIDKEDLDDNLRSNLKTEAQLWEFHGQTMNGDMKEAEKANIQAEARLSENGNINHWKMYHEMRGIMEIKKGNYELAISHLEEAWDNPVTWYYTGVAWEKSGNERKARKYYEQVANHYSNSLELGTIRQKAVAALEE